MSITCGELYDFIDSQFPFALQESWDNSGLLVGSREQDADKVLLTLDITSSVVREANALGAQLIISHHPVIFRPLASLSPDDVPYQLAQAGIAALCMHTNFDIATGGLNTALAARLGLADTCPLHVTAREAYKKIVVFVPKGHEDAVYRAMAQAGAGCVGAYDGCAFFGEGMGSFRPLEGAQPFIGTPGEQEQTPEVRIEMVCAPAKIGTVIRAMRAAHPYEEPAFDILTTDALYEENGLGQIGTLQTAMDPRAFARFVKEKLQAGGVRVSAGNRPVLTVAVCGGSGGDELMRAVHAGADAYVTGDVKHHEWLLAREYGITLIDAGHFSTENQAIPVLRKLLDDTFGNRAEFLLSETCTDPAEFI